ncbi:MAG: aldo/keto reductase, partial [Verrucomicrobia bacterium]|nr:aldo/keto reductase [Verrucomicrobiota bacterium]
MQRRDDMHLSRMNRRQFLHRTAALASAALLPPSLLHAASATKRTATDQVALGRTGLRISRLGFGAGSNSGNVQRNLGQETFNKLIHYAYERGITYIDCAQSYKTFEWIGDVIKGLPREKLFLQSKIGGKPEDVLAAIDLHRRVYDTDYIDSVLIHCMVKTGWTDEWKRIMDGFDEAKSRKWIRAKGVSCHSLPALKAGADCDWTDVHLVRVNPQGHVMDTPEEKWNATSDVTRVSPVMAEIKKMHAKGHGVIGMKII